MEYTNLGGHDALKIIQLYQNGRFTPTEKKKILDNIQIRSTGVTPSSTFDFSKYRKVVLYGKNTHDVEVKIEPQLDGEGIGYYDETTSSFKTSSISLPANQTSYVILNTREEWINGGLFSDAFRVIARTSITPTIGGINLYVIGEM